MPNLTEDKNLVRRLNSVAPCPDHYLVVFKRIGDGKRLRTCVPPGEPFKKPIFESPESFIAFAVPGDRNLRHRFQRTYKTHDLLHNFTLNFTLDYRVSDAARLVEKIDLDPLKRLEDEVDLLLVQRNKSLNWSIIEREQIDLEDVLFKDGGRRDDAESNLERLSGFASTQGFEVKRVVVTRELPSEEISVSTRNLEASREQAILTIDQGTLELKQTLDHRLEDDQKGFERRNRVADGIADNVKRAFDQATDQIRSLDDIQRAVGKVGQIQNAVLGVASGGAASITAPSAPLIAGGAAFGALPEATASTSPLGTLLSAISMTLGSLTCDPADRRQLLSTALHLVAESSRGEDASTEVLTTYKGALSAVFSRVLPLLDQNQIKLLRKLQDSANLQKELS